jgi:energy-converting hydrogenase Eha subunit A
MPDTYLTPLQGNNALANPYPRTPAMAASVSDHIWKIDEIVALPKDPDTPPVRHPFTTSVSPPTGVLATSNTVCSLVC